MYEQLLIRTEAETATIQRMGIYLVSCRTAGFHQERETKRRTGITRLITGNDHQNDQLGFFSNVFHIGAVQEPTQCLWLTECRMTWHH